MLSNRWEQRTTAGRFATHPVKATENCRLGQRAVRGSNTVKATENCRLGQSAVRGSNTVKATENCRLGQSAVKGRQLTSAGRSGRYAEQSVEATDKCRPVCYTICVSKLLLPIDMPSNRWKQRKPEAGAHRKLWKQLRTAG